jgi:integrase
VARQKRHKEEAKTRDPDRYLNMRAGHWHYQRRVPVNVRDIDSRDLIRKTLRTSSLEIARLRRDAIEEADNLYWASLAAGDTPADSVDRYEAAVKRATAMGFFYKPAEVLAETATTEEIIERVLQSAGQGPAVTEALLGGSSLPKLPVGEAMEFYLDNIGIEEVRGHSPKQVRSWKKVKRRASSNFIKVVGDVPLLDITAEQAQAFWRWWFDRIAAGEVGASAGNRDVGNMRKLYREFGKWHGASQPNPFNDLNFTIRKSKRNKRPPFSVEWIRDVLLAPNALAGLNDDARDILLILVETGARPSEICNIPAERIKLGAKVPHLVIEFADERALKTESSEREIPLLGVSLDAMKRHPHGFPRYCDKEDNLSATLMKYLRSNGLLESERHGVYSLRHSFEKRMMEAGLSDDFRRLIMGHHIERPEYGDGGSLEWRREQLQKIVLPVDSASV